MRAWKDSHERKSFAFGCKTPKHSDQTFFRAVMLLVFASEYVFPEGGIYEEIYLEKKERRRKKKSKTQENKTENTLSFRKKRTIQEKR